MEHHISPHGLFEVRRFIPPLVVAAGRRYAPALWAAPKDEATIIEATECLIEAIASLHAEARSLSVCGEPVWMNLDGIVLPGDLPGLLTRIVGLGFPGQERVNEFTIEWKNSLKERQKILLELDDYFFLFRAPVSVIRGAGLNDLEKVDRFRQIALAAINQHFRANGRR
jgi:hypothetical protein